MMGPDANVKNVFLHSKSMDFRKSIGFTELVARDIKVVVLNRAPNS